MRHCSKPGCSRTAVGTLTYDYQNSTAVLGPLATNAEPHSYDLCANHVDHLTVPRGWEVVRLTINYDPVPPSEDDLMALVEAVREAAVQADNVDAAPSTESRFSSFGPGSERATGRRRPEGLTVISGTVDAFVEETEPAPDAQRPVLRGPFSAPEHDIPDGS